MQQASNQPNSFQSERVPHKQNTNFKENQSNFSNLNQTAKTAALLNSSANHMQTLRNFNTITHELEKINEKICGTHLNPSSFLLDTQKMPEGLMSTKNMDGRITKKATKKTS